MSRRWIIVVVGLLAALNFCQCKAEPVKPVARTRVLTTATAGHSQKLTADITGATDLYLVVTDAGDGYSCDWADWVAPSLSGPAGTVRLTSLKWKSAQAQWGTVRVGRNAAGGPLKVAGTVVPDGIGTHAYSVIHYVLPRGYTTFTATCALDNGGTDQGNATSVQFAVYTQKPPPPADGSASDHTPESATTALDVAEDLQVTLFASEPMIASPSNIDVDHLGRVWVCEVVNYRHFANKNNPAREEGDRILVLEDTDGDGRADKSTTFYQGRDIDSAHGVCVLGNRVIVSVGENVLNFYDDDGDLRADRREVMFTGIKGSQHDHGIHSFTFGPDGRLYFNFGNAGNELHTPDGKLVVDVSGREVVANRRPYQEGMAFRCELDGTKVDTIGWNFRNNWELCVDSFGSVWQSDNDDDGNRGVRINYVMEYGNYGYRDERTGAGWREPRTGMAAEIPRRHWHLNDPGVVPNLLQTGAGSPTGILCYEGRLLPPLYRNQLIHCDAGPNVVRCYEVREKGAGFEATIHNILVGARDQWFRPSDVCAAPDGSLIVADWYDPGVGGHRQGDIERGRLFRVAPPDRPYSIPRTDLTTLEGAARALTSPNVATRFLAWQKLHNAQTDAENVLADMYRNHDNPRMQARALWLLGQLPGDAGSPYVSDALKRANPNLRITALRIARRTGRDVSRVAETLVDDPSPQVRREVAIALRHNVTGPQKAKLWARLAARLPAHDRWYLEALGIAADNAWDECLAAWDQLAAALPDIPEDVHAGIIWRSRASTSAQRIVGQIIRLAAESELSEDDARSHVLMFFRALDFQPSEKTAQQVRRLLAAETLGAVREHLRPVIIAESLQRLDSVDFSKDADARAALNQALNELQGTSQFIQLVERFDLEDRYPDLLHLAQQHPAEQVGVEAIRALLRAKQFRLLTQALRSEDLKAAIATAQVMGNSLDNAISGPLIAVIQDPMVDLNVRREAVRAVARASGGARRLAELIESRKLDPALTQTAAAALYAAPSRSTREIAARLFPLPPVKEGKPLPPISELVKMKGDPVNGRLVFFTTGTCHKCHRVEKLGQDLGPDLSEIGSKLSREAMFESIIYPSAGISHNYEAYTVLLANGTTVSGLITSETDDKISIRGTDLIVRTYDKSEVEDVIKQQISLMPADLQKMMTVQEIVDVVEFMQTLKKKK